MNTLLEVLEGKLETDVKDETLVNFTLDALIENAESPHGATLLAALTKPDRLRPSDQKRGTVTAPTLHASALKVMPRKQLPALRAQLASQLSTVAAEFRPALVTLLMEKRLDNLKAQVELFSGGPVDAANTQKLQAAFVEHARMGFHHVMGTSDKAGTGFGGGGFTSPGGGAPGAGAPGGAPAGGAPQPGGTPGAGGAGGTGTAAGTSSGNAKAEHIEDALTALWSQRFVASVQTKLSMAGPNDAEILKLGAALPFSSTRRAFQQMIDRNWQRGTGDFAAAKLNESLLDPGLLLVLKTVPWKARLKPKTASGTGFAGGGFGQPGNPGQGKNAAGGDKEKDAKRAGDKSDKSDQWREATEQYVRALCARFRAVKRGEGNDPPVKLPKDSDPNTEYYLRWPEELPATLQQQKVPAMTVHYLRLDMQAPLLQVQRHFATAVPKANNHALDNGAGYWYESRQSRDGTLKSYDVIVSRANTSAGGALAGGGVTAGTPPAGGTGKKRRTAAPPEAVSVDILYVEIASYDGK